MTDEERFELGTAPYDEPADEKDYPPEPELPANEPEND